MDVSGSEGRDPIEDFETINRELKNFNEELASRPQIVAANKCDMASAEQIDAFRTYIEAKGLPFYPISAATRQGVDALTGAVAAQLDQLPPIRQYEPEPAPQPEVAEGGKRPFTIRVEDGVYIVEADWLMSSLGMVDMEDYESLQYFQRVLIKSGIIEELERMGINEGDTVSILNFEFDYIK